MNRRDSLLIEQAVAPGFTKSMNPVIGTRLKLKSFDARKLCELALAVMNRSIPESRVDGKPTPAVGAVLYLPDGSVETAFRGELREGEHGEFTLLERKLRHLNLEGSILFTTLEPCLNRRRQRCHRKQRCQENKGVKENKGVRNEWHCRHLAGAQEVYWREQNFVKFPIRQSWY